MQLIMMRQKAHVGKAREVIIPLCLLVRENFIPLHTAAMTLSLLFALHILPT